MDINKKTYIKRSDGSNFYDIYIKEISITDNVMGDCFASGSFLYKDSSIANEINESLYIQYRGNSYYISEQPTITQNNKDNAGLCKFDVKFSDVREKLKNIPFTDEPLPSTSEFNYRNGSRTVQFYGDLREFVDRLNASLLANAPSADPKKQWKAVLQVDFEYDYEPEEVTLSDCFITDALSAMYDIYKMPYVFDGYTIYIGKPVNELEHVFKFGQGVGLRNNDRTSKKNKIVTRIAGYGSTTNIPDGYPIILNDKGERVKHIYTRPHLMPSVWVEAVKRKVLNGSSEPLIDYYDAIGDDYVNQINPESPSYHVERFEKAYPTIIGATYKGQAIDELKSVPITNDYDDSYDEETGEYKVPYFELTFHPLGFDVYAQAAVTGEMMLSMRSGDCRGANFKFAVDEDLFNKSFYVDGVFTPNSPNRNYELFPDSTDASITMKFFKDPDTFGRLYPNPYQIPKSGDKFVILQIEMPQKYIDEAQLRLDGLMKSFMIENNYHKYEYPLSFSEHFLHTHLDILKAINTNTLISFEYNGKKLSLPIQSITISEGKNPLPSYDIKLTDEISVVYNSVGQVSKNVEDLKAIIARNDISIPVLKRIFHPLEGSYSLPFYANDLFSNGNGKFAKRLNVGQSVVVGEDASVDKDIRVKGNAIFGTYKSEEATPMMVMEVEDNITEISDSITEIYTSKIGGSLGSLENTDPSFDTVPDDTYSLQKRNGIYYPVKGGGGAAQYTVRLVNNLPSLNLYAVKGEPTYIDFTFLSQYRDGDKVVNTNERGYCQVYYRTGSNEYKEVYNSYIQSVNPTKIDVAKYLLASTGNIMVKVTGEETGKATTSLVYAYQTTTLSISADNFQWWNIFETNPVIPINIGGNINKILRITITGEGYEKVYDVNLGTTIYTETAFNYSLPHPGKTGVFNVSMHVTSSDGTIKTRTIVFDIIAIITGATDKLIAVNNVLSKAVNWSTNKLFEYTMYDGGRANTSAKFTVSKGNEVFFSSEDDRIATGAKQNFTLPLEIETLDNTDFQIVAKVLDGTKEIVSLTFDTDNSAGYSAESGAVLYINPKKRNNNQANYKSIINEMTGTEISATWSNMNWGNDGWIDNSLRIFAGSSVDINYKPFVVESARTGKTIELDFSVLNVTDYEKEILSIASNALQFTGLKIYPDNVIVHSQALKNDDFQSINFRDSARIRLTLTIMPDAYGNSGFNLCIIYINGVKNREFNYENNDYFQNQNNIVIGSEYSDIDIYGIRVYDSALTSDSVRRNYINWLTSNAEKAEVQAINDLLNETGTDISYEKVRGKINTMVFDNTFPSLSNPNKFVGNLQVEFVNRPELNATITKVTTDGQGTSSKFYYIWNQRYTLDKALSIVTLADGSTTTGVWKMLPNVPPCGRFTAKKNFASSMQSHKMGSVNSYNDLFKALGLTNEAIQDNPEVRIAVYQEPFVGFQKSTNEQGEDIYTFMGLYTMGADKGDKNTFGYDTKKFPNMIAIEGCDNAPLCTLFRIPWRADLVKYDTNDSIWKYNGVKSWELSAGEVASISKWIPAYNLTYQCSPRLKPFVGTIAELNLQVDTYKNEPYEYWTSDYGVYYYESSEGKFMPSDIGEGSINLITQLVDKGYGLSSSDLVGKTPDQLNELFITARIQKFRKEAGTYFDTRDAIFHRNWVEFNAATDQRAKNTYPYFFAGKWHWRTDDTDTIWSITNQGLSKKKYSVEIHDKYSDGAPVWNGETSNFWNLIDLAFKDEIVTEMRLFMSKMESLGGLNTGDDFDKLYAFFDKYYFSKAQRYFPMSLYNADAKFTYETSKLAYIDGRYTNDTDPITQSLGDHFSAEQRWIMRRIVYMMSKYSFGMFSTVGTDNITVRAAGNTITYDITPAIDLYPNIANGTTIVRGARTKAGELCRMNIELSGSGDQQNTILGASYLQDIGDWYDKNVSGSMSIQGRMLREIRLGSKTQPITIAISSLTIANCVSLRKLILSRISTLRGSINLSSCTHLKELYTDGTGLTQIVLPRGGGLETIEYGSQNQYINLQNFPLLKDSGIIIDTCVDKITDVFIADCPGMNAINLLQNIYTSQIGQANHALKRIRCTGFNVTCADNVVEMLLKMADGSYNGLDANGVATSGLPILEGTINLYSVGEYQLGLLAKSYPDLVIKYQIMRPTPTTTFVFASSQSKPITNAVFTCNFPFTKVNDTTYTVKVEDGTNLSISFEADNHQRFTANYITAGTRTQNYSVTYIPLRTIRVKVFGQTTYVAGATVVVNGETYLSDSSGNVTLRSGAAVSGTATYIGYSKESFSYAAITNDTTNTVEIYAAVDVKFIVKSSAGVLLEGATVKVGDNTATTNIYGEAILSLAKGSQSYTVSRNDYRDYSSTVSVGTTAMTVNVSLEPAFVNATFTVKDDSNAVVAGVTVEANGVEGITDANGQCVLRIPSRSTVSYRVYGYPIEEKTGSFTTAIADVSVAVSVVIDIITLKPEEDGNIQMLVRGTRTSLSIRSTDGRPIIDWGDGSTTNATGLSITDYSHTYTTAGLYQVKVLNCENVDICRGTNPAPSVIAYWSIGVSKVSNLTFETNYSNLKYVGDVFKNDANRTSAYRLFYGCGNLLYVEAPSLSVMTKVTDASWMHHSCVKLKQIDFTPLASWVNVTNASYLIRDCAGLTSVDFTPLASWVKVTNAMFLMSGCIGLTSIDFTPLSSWVNVTDASFLITGNLGLTSIDFTPLASWVNVTNAGNLIGSSGLTSVDFTPLASWVKVTNASYLMTNCRKLTSVDFTPLASWVNVVDVSYLVYQCTGLTFVDFSPLASWVKVTNANYLMTSTALKSVDLTFMSYWVKMIGNTSLLSSSTELTKITVNATIPFFLSSGALTNGNSCPIYVPDEAVDTYKTATNWNAYASRIKPISEMP